ncbi:hypothetical protein RCL1_005348 [Eukaryota sp. TZLM3-RCL]
MPFCEPLGHKLPQPQILYLEPPNFTRFYMSIPPIPPKLDSFESFFQSGLFSDVNIQVADRTFSLHRIILANASEFFKALFSNEWKESGMDCIPVHFDDVDSFQLLLKFIYAGIIEFSPSNVLNLLVCASQFQVNSLISKCSDYMERSVSHECAMSYIQAASVYGLIQVENRCISILAEAFGPIAEQDVAAFNSLTLKQLKCLTDREVVYATNEYQIARVLASYCAHNRLQSDVVTDLFSCIRWQQLTEEEFSNFIYSLPNYVSPEFAMKVAHQRQSSFDNLLGPRFTCSARLDWDVPHFSTISSKQIKSPFFHDVRGRCWQVVLYPQSAKGAAKFSSVYLYAERSDGNQPGRILEPSDQWSRFARFKIKIIDPETGLRLHGYESVGHQFESNPDASSLNWGWESFTRADTLRTFLKEDTLYMRIVVATQEMFGDDDGCFEEEEEEDMQF